MLAHVSVVEQLETFVIEQFLEVIHQETYSITVNNSTSVEETIV